MPISPNQLRKARGKRTISEAAFEISKALGSAVSSQSVHQWENGVCVPQADKLEAIARAYGVTIDSLFAADPQQGAAA